jgi:hypothetical protein
MLFRSGDEPCGDQRNEHARPHGEAVMQRNLNARGPDLERPSRRFRRLAMREPQGICERIPAGAREGIGQRRSWSVTEPRIAVYSIKRIVLRGGPDEERQADRPQQASRKDYDPGNSRPVRRERPKTKPRNRNK